MAKKKFFRDRGADEIKALENGKNVYSQRHLVERIDDLDPSEEFLAIRTPIIPGKFFRGGLTGAQASRKCYKHGDYIVSSQPETQADAFSSQERPLDIRERDFEEKLRSRPQEETNYLGYSFRPVQGRDRTKRVVPFVWLPEAFRLFSYAENMTQGVKVESYSDSKRVAKEGASVEVEVPSRTQKKSRYKFKLMHVPVKRGLENLASVLGLKPALLKGEEGEIRSPRVIHDDYNIRYTWENEREGSDVITFYPHDIAGYIGIIKDELSKEEKNRTPIDMNPFAFPSQRWARFASNLNNNVLAYDKSLKSKDKLRKLHLAEKSILSGRAIGVFGNEFAYWDPKVDGLIKDYDWSKEGK